MSTVDGALTALDTQGHTLWSYHLHDPLFSSTLSYVEVGSVCVCVCAGLSCSMTQMRSKMCQSFPPAGE